MLECLDHLTPMKALFGSSLGINISPDSNLLFRTEIQHFKSQDDSLYETVWKQKVVHQLLVIAIFTYYSKYLEHISHYLFFHTL